MVFGNLLNNILANSSFISIPSFLVLQEGIYFFRQVAGFSFFLTYLFKVDSPSYCAQTAQAPSADGSRCTSCFQQSLVQNKSLNSRCTETLKVS